MECPTGITLMLAVDDANFAVGTRSCITKIADREFAKQLLQHHREHCTVCANYKRPNAQSVYSKPSGGDQQLVNPGRLRRLQQQLCIDRRLRRRNLQQLFQ